MITTFTYNDGMMTMCIYNDGMMTMCIYNDGMLTTCTYNDGMMTMCIYDDGMFPLILILTFSDFRTCFGAECTLLYTSTTRLYPGTRWWQIQ